MADTNRRWIDWLLGLLLALLSLGVYGVTLSPGPYPGQSANFIVESAGLFPKMTPAYPVWGGVAWLVSRLPWGSLWLRLNLLSAFAGAAAVWLLYAVVSQAIRAVVEVRPSNEGRVRTASRLAGIAASLVLAFSVPFWLVSVRAYPASFHTALLLWVSLVFVRYGVGGRRRTLFLFAFLYGVGVVEFASFIIFAPLFGFGLLFLMWRHGELGTRVVLGTIAAAVAGLSLYLLAAWAFYGSRGYRLREYDGFFQILWFTWRDQYMLIARSLPSKGWLVVLAVTVFPWLTSLAVAFRALNEESDWTYYLLHGTMAALAFCVLFGARFAPWPMLGFGHLLVTPYVLTASLVGYLAGYLYLLPGSWWPETDESWQLWIRKWLGPLLTAPVLAAACAAPVLNVAEADGRSAAFPTRYARDVIRSMEDRSWLVTDGTLDSVLMVLAYDMKKPLRLLSLAAGDREVYMKYVASMFASPALRNCARLGMGPFLQEWLATDPAVEKTVAVMGVPDVWIEGGFTAVPNRLVFGGVKDRSAIQPDELMAEHRRFWADSEPFWAARPRRPDVLAPLSDRLVRNAGFVANNLGVVMEDLGRTNEAFEAYAEARKIDPSNVSALLNQSVMLDRGYRSAEAAGVRRDIKAMADGLKARYPIWSLSRYYGYVRMPEAFSSLGWTWALSGRPALALAGLRRALDLAPEERKSEIRENLAEVYFMQDDRDESEALHRDVLKKDPSNQRALVGMARISAKRAAFDEALQWLDKAAKAGGRKEQMEIERAAVFAGQGKLKEARDTLKGVIDSGGSDVPRARVMLATVLLRLNDRPALEECLEGLRETRAGQAMAAAIEGQISWRERDWEHARRAFERAANLNPGSREAFEWLLRLDMLQGQTDSGNRHAAKLLQLDPGHALGNYVLGSLQISEGEYELAEDSLRKSLERRKTPGALNDLAWLLQRRESYAEAEKRVREALAMDENAYQSWDTLGVILTKTGRADDAAKAFEKALGIFRESPSVFLHMAELESRRGNAKRAGEFADMAATKREQLSPDDQEKLDAILRTVAK